MHAWACMCMHVHACMRMCMNAHPTPIPSVLPAVAASKSLLGGRGVRPVCMRACMCMCMHRLKVAARRARGGASLCACVRACMCMHLLLSVNACMCMYEYLLRRLARLRWAWWRVIDQRAHLRMCMHVYACVRMGVHVCACMCMYVHVCACMCMCVHGCGRSTSEPHLHHTQCTYMHAVHVRVCMSHESTCTIHRAWVHSSTECMHVEDAWTWVDVCR